MRPIRVIATVTAGTIVGAAFAALFREYIRTLVELDQLRAACVTDLAARQPTVEEIRGYTTAGSNAIEVFGPNGHDSFELHLLSSGQIEISRLPEGFSFIDLVAAFRGTQLSVDEGDNSKILVDDASSIGPSFDLISVARMLAAAVRERQAQILERVD